VRTGFLPLLIVGIGLEEGGVVMIAAATDRYRKCVVDAAFHYSSWGFLCGMTPQ